MGQCGLFSAFDKHHVDDAQHVARLRVKQRAAAVAGVSGGIQLKNADAKHRSTKACKSGTIMRQQRGLAVAARQAREVTFTIYGQELRSVETFKYLGRPMSCTDGNAAAVF